MAFGFPVVSLCNTPNREKPIIKKKAIEEAGEPARNCITSSLTTKKHKQGSLELRAPDKHGGCSSWLPFKTTKKQAKKSTQTADVQ